MSDLENLLNGLANRVREHRGTIATEEAVKTSVVLPFLQYLGYDVFNPGEVIPEFTADAVGKRGEKVDYAITLDGEISILIECKALSTRLDRKHLSQLFRYFTVTNAKFAILTNGQVYEFYTDLEEPNKLDQRAFFTFDLLDFGPSALQEIRKFQKDQFSVEKILATAERLKYVSSVKKVVAREIENPSDAFVRFIASQVHDGRVTSQVRSQVAAATKAAFKQVIRDAVKQSLSSALKSTSETDVAEESSGNSIETTEDELQGMLTVRAIVSDTIAPERVDLRDSKSYCAVLVDDNNRKPLCRLHFNRKQKYLGLFDGTSEERVPIASLADIYKFSERLRETARKYI